ncbi:hypothetical protein TPHV1_390003 [Treponema phagedenis]|uniref:Uncharacterized protein n=1 Tax=Treponema phagedenis TaxID=162 RepID=A0A0B7GVI4_TREPH|nr:hypothetical protein TPHV1_390003 [Treponema phagedenis]
MKYDIDVTWVENEIIRRFFEWIMSIELKILFLEL